MESPEKEIQALKDSKLDKVLLEGISSESLSALDTSGETDAVKKTISVLIDLINKLRTK